LKFLVLGFEVLVVHGASQMFGRFQSAFHESLVHHHLKRDIGKFTPLPGLYLLAHGFEVPLHSIHADRYAIDQGE
jgi:hypothetical protein